MSFQYILKWEINYFFNYLFIEKMSDFFDRNLSNKIKDIAFIDFFLDICYLLYLFYLFYYFLV